VPDDHSELVIALVGAVGTDLTMVCAEIAAELSEYQFGTETLRLSSYLAEQAETDFRDLPFDELVWEGMTEGDNLRQRWERGDALALHAVSDIVATREEKSDGYVDFTQEGETEQIPRNLTRFAFILRSLKTPDELETLRSIYGPRLIVIGAYSPYDKRLKHLDDEIQASRKSRDRETWLHTPEALISRDEKEGITGGQALSDTFHRADFFVRAWDRGIAKKDIKRTMEILFGDPFRTPTRDEFGQFQAAGAALRSAELGRQVGAAIAAPNGSVIALGTNEVPRYGGGSFWEGEAGADNRDFAVLKHDSNRKQFDELADAISSEITHDVDALVEELSTGNPEQEALLLQLRNRLAERLPADLRRGGLKDLTEFGRAVHAEMSAISDAVLRGVSVAGATLHTTTFPCHNCARHIIGVGIERIVFIEPYDKSRALTLHDDSLVAEGFEATNKASLEPFVGVAPRRYLEMFDAAARKRLGHIGRRDGDGNAEVLVKASASPVFVDAGLKQLRPELPAYRAKELLALDYFDELSSGGQGQDGSHEGTG
jgi:deoxycytidylate deaminase